jgi:hypothetical protein
MTYGTLAHKLLRISELLTVAVPTIGNPAQKVGQKILSLS